MKHSEAIKLKPSEAWKIYDEKARKKRELKLKNETKDNKTKS